MSDRVYNILKWLSMVVLDAFGVAFESLSTLWGWPLGEKVGTTCQIVSVFIGAIVGTSSIKYWSQKDVED